MFLFTRLRRFAFQAEGIPGGEGEKDDGEVVAESEVPDDDDDDEDGAGEGEEEEEEEDEDGSEGILNCPDFTSCRN